MMKHCLSLALILAIVFVEPALAQSLGGAETLLQRIVSALTGNIAISIAVIAAILIGIGFWFRFVDLRTIGFFVVGCIIVFGAREIVDLLRGGGG